MKNVFPIHPSEEPDDLGHLPRIFHPARVTTGLNISDKSLHAGGRETCVLFHCPVQFFPVGGVVRRPAPAVHTPSLEGSTLLGFSCPNLNKKPVS